MSALKERLSALLRDFLHQADEQQTAETLRVLSEITENPDLSTLSDPPELPEPSEHSDSSEKSDSSEPSVSSEPSEPSEPASKCCIPFHIRRNLAISIRQIRDFADEHQLAIEIIESALRILLEIGADLAKGKVTVAMLQCALKILNYDRDKEKAREEGVVKGRNEMIGKKYFDDADDGLPHLTGGPEPDSHTSSIFDLARQAKSAER